MKAAAKGVRDFTEQRQLQDSLHYRNWGALRLTMNAAAVTVRICEALFSANALLGPAGSHRAYRWSFRGARIPGVEATAGSFTHDCAPCYSRSISVHTNVTGTI